MRPDEFWNGRRRDWDSDPDYFAPSILPFGNGQHIDTGIMVVCYSIRGGWSFEAVEEARNSFARVLPGAHICRILTDGVVRVTIFLGIARTLHRRPLPVPNDDSSRLEETFAASAWAFDRAAARMSGLVPDTVRPYPPVALAEPAPIVVEAFRQAETELALIGLMFSPSSSYDPHTTWLELEDSAGMFLDDYRYYWSSAR